MLSQSSQLSVSYLIICPLIAVPATYNLIRHGKYGLLGWLYLLGYIVLRMAGSGLQIASPTSKTAATIGSVGLSPLILAVLGVLHES